MSKLYQKLQIKLLKRYYSWRYNGLTIAVGRRRLNLPILNKRHTIAAVCALMILVFGVSTLMQPFAAAKSLTLASKDIMSGYRDFNQVQTGADNKSISLQRGDIGKWDGGDGLQMPRTQVYTDSNIEYGPNNSLFLLTGRSGCNFERYEMEVQTWTELTLPPVGCGYGSQLVYDGTSKMYYFPGNNSNRFFQYDIGADSWVSLPNVPTTVGDGAAASYVSTGGNAAIYLMRGNSSASLWQYSFQSNSWNTKAPFPTTSSVEYGTSMVWDKSNSIYIISNYRGEFKRYSISSDTWTNLATPSNATWQSYSLSWINNQVYNSSFRRDNEISYMSKYNPSLNSWVNLASPPIGTLRDFAINTATDSSDNIYTLYGHYDRPILYRYNVTADKWIGNRVMLQDQSFASWEQMYDGGENVYYIGGRDWGSMDKVFKKNLTTGDVSRIGSQFGTNNGIVGAYYNNALYTFQWFGGVGFSKFDLATNDMVTLPTAPYSSNWGSDIVDGGDGYLYASFGYRSDFFRFSEAIGWQRMASMPQGIGEGGQLVRTGSTIHALVGSNTQRLMAYNITTNTWSYSADTPKGGISHGAYLTGDGTRYLYAGLGSRTDNTNRLFYRFDTVSNTWLRMADLPQNTQVGARAFYQTTTNKVWVSQGSTTFNMWSWTPSATNNVTSGSWYSKALDLEHVKSWQSLIVSTTGSGTTNAYTRTSDNGRVWSDWQLSAGTVVGSAPKRFAQIKITLAGDGSTTPTVTDITLNYDQETDPPNIPSQFLASDKKGGSALTSGTSYEHQHPYFSWGGANDGTNGSGVAGYYVYYGTNSNADPVIDGSYQTQTDYTVTTAMTAGSIYYIKIKVKDNLGNISDTATYFSYNYFYISPPGSFVATSPTDFGQGTNTGVSIGADGSMSLVQQAQGAWGVGTMKMMPNSSTGGAMTVINDSLYVLRGSNSNEFWRYDTEANSWSVLASLPSSANTGSSISWDGGNYIYALAGASTNSFYRYDIQNDTWESLPSAPAFVQAGSDMRYVGENKFAMMFSGAGEFYIYDAISRTFTSRTSPPLTVSAWNTGSGMWYDGADTVYVYFGAYHEWSPNRKSLAAYSLSQDSWRTMSAPPHDVYYAEKNLTGDGKGNLYVFGNDHVLNRSSKNMAMMYNIASDTWSNVADSPAQVVRGTITSDGKRYIYIIPSIGNSRKIVRYDTLEKKFTPTEKAIQSWQRLPWDLQSSWNWQAGNASSAVYDGNDSVYAMGGNEHTWSRFIKRSVSTGETIYLPPAPIIGIGGSLAYSNNTLYYTTAAYRSEFYKFDQSDLSWKRLANLPGVAYRPGSSALIALKDGTLLTLAGNNNRLYKFTPDSGSGTWTTMSNAPGTIFNGSARYDGNNTVYVLAGNNTTTFYKYTVSTDSWATISPLPANANFGASMAINDGVIYATVGNNTTAMYLYNIASNTWQAGPNAPEYFRYGAELLNINNEFAMAFAGQDSPDIWRFNFPGTNRAYSGLATHISQPMMVEGIFDYAGIQAAVSTPANTKIEFWTRSSVDGSTWGEWMLTDQIKQYASSMSVRVASAPQKYTQIKAVLYSYDNMSTPVVFDYALDYYFDTTPPSNPTVLNVYEDPSKAKAVINNKWYNIANPLFDWPNPGEAGGATDGPLGSNLKGYYVYVGTDPTAIPRTSGVFVTSTDFTPQLITSGTYYFRLQAVDMTGNVDPAIYSPFIYKFDNTPPDNPALIVVTPSGFTSRNNYTFQWPNGFDENSGIAGYCYYTGALSGPFAVETCQSTTELKDVSAAYQSGANVLYLRTKDIAGNFSTNYTQVSYYYSTDPPTPVLNLRAIPPSSEQNLFAFTWDYPVMFAGDPDQLTYCYSINTLPTPTNTTCTGDMFISAFKAATQQGTNVMYMIAKDEAGTANWNNYASANFIANTVSPGIPLNMVVNDTSDSASSRWSLTLTWNPPTFTGNGVTQYVLERSLDANVFKEIGRVSNTAYVDLSVTPDKTYFYRVKAADSVDNQGGASAVVAKSAKGSFATPPKLVSEPRVLPSYDQGTINWVTDRSSTSFIYYGTTPSQLIQSKGTLDLATEHSVTIAGLIPSTIYYYRVQSFDTNRSYDLNSANSQLYTFKTTDSARIFQVNSSDVGLDSAVISWQTSVPTRAKIEYGPTSQYGFTQENAVGYTSNHLFRLANLQSGSRIHYRIVALTEFGSRVVSDDYVVTTIARPIITNVRFQPIEDGNNIAVRLNWTTNVPTSSEVTYRALGTKKELAQAELLTQHDILIEDLASSTDYDFELRGRDQYGNSVLNGGHKWQSGVDTKEPTITNLSVSTTTTMSVGNAKAQMIISWQTDEPTTTQIRYDLASAKSLGKKTQLDTEPTVNHVVVISGLEAAQVYKIQATSRDISGNTAYGSEVVTVTPDVDANPLDIILDMLQKVFRL